MNEQRINVVVNGQQIERDAPPYWTLMRWLRDRAAVYDVKYGCGEGVCGACAVLLDGNAVNSCLVLAVQADGHEVTTAAGLLAEDGSFGSLQQAFLDYGAVQCGFCTPGMLVTSSGLLSSGRELDRSEIREALHGNLCRCSGYQAIVDAIADVDAHQPAEADR